MKSRADSRGSLEDDPVPFRHSRLIALVTMLALAAWLVSQQPGFLIAAFILPAILAVSIDRGKVLPAADHDTLTGLDRRHGLVQALQREVGRPDRLGHGTVCIVLELDRFKQLEERLERDALDDLLRLTARRLVAAVRDSDTCARLEGPAFGVALSATDRLTDAGAIELAARLQAALMRPATVAGQDIAPSVSVGIALAYGGVDASGERLLQSATLAMIEGQRGGPAALRVFDAAMRQRLKLRDTLGREGAAAIAAGELVPHFQPQVCARSGKVTGVEALARWERPDVGVISPADFLPALEDAGLMGALGRRMLESALAAMRDWDDSGLDIGHVGVNFSPVELRDPGLVDHVAFTLERFGLAPGRLSVEVLETVVAGAPNDAISRNLEALARLGCGIDLDDFGTGHASITSIRRFPVSRLKIDRSFVTGIDVDPDQQRMVSAILTMAERLGLDAIAEGVETEAELDKLRDLGCIRVQGFYMARPMPAGDIPRWMRARQLALERSDAEPLGRQTG